MYTTTFTVPKVSAEDIKNLHRDYPFTKSHKIEVVDSVEAATSKAVDEFNANSDRYEYVSTVLEAFEDTENNVYLITVRVAGD